MTMASVPAGDRCPLSSWLLFLVSVAVANGRKAFDHILEGRQPADDEVGTWGFATDQVEEIVMDAKGFVPKTRCSADTLL